MKTPIFLERGGRRYRLVTGGSDCTKSCSFARRDKGRDKCERNCYLPGWFQRLDLAGASLVEIGETKSKKGAGNGKQNRC